MRKKEIAKILVKNKYFQWNKRTLGFKAPLKSSLLLTKGISTPTFTRPTTASVTDFEGVVNTAKINEARFEGARRVENLLRYTEDFTQSDWLVFNYTKTTGIEDPNGGTAAVRITNTSGSGGDFRQEISNTQQGSTYNICAMFKGSGTMRFGIQRRGGDYGYYDSVEINLTDEWTKYCVSAEKTDTISVIAWYITFVDAGESVDIAFPQFEQFKGTQTEPSEYVSTDVSNTDGIELVTNGDFDNADNWVVGSNWTISGGVASCDGAQTGNVSVYQENALKSPKGKTYLVKYDIASHVSGESRIYLGGIDYGVTETSVGEHEMIITADTPSNTRVYFQGRVGYEGSVSSISVEEIIYHGAGVDGVKYFETDRDGNPISKDILKGYLCEEQRTNKFNYSEEMDDPSWIKGANVTITPNCTTAPDGTETADCYNISTTTGRLIDKIIIENPASNTYTVSFYIKAISSTTITVEWRRDASTVFSEGLIVVTDSWQRIERTYTYDATAGTDFRARIYDDSGSTGDRFYIWGMQLESCCFASSYIKTEASTVTKTGDSLTYGIEDLKQGVGSYNVEINHLGFGVSTTPRVLTLSDATIDNRIASFVNKTVLSASVVLITGGVSQGTLNSPVDLIIPNVFHKIALSYINDDVDLFTNGALKASDNSATLATNLTTVGVGVNETGNLAQFNGTIKNVEIYNKKLIDQEMIRITQ